MARASRLRPSRDNRDGCAERGWPHPRRVARKNGRGKFGAFGASEAAAAEASRAPGHRPKSANHFGRQRFRYVTHVVVAFALPGG
jgi:hypothetical protein